MKAFLRKEWMEWNRTGRTMVLLAVFVLFGIMNPAFAKLTPWMMEVMSESLAEAGIVAAAVQVDAMTSWVQFYKNIPLGLIIFVLINSGSFTSEYEKGTLIPVVTKGLSRRKILAAKTVFLFASWTALLQRAVSPEDYYAGMAAAGVTALVCMVTAVWCFDRKQL